MKRMRLISGIAGTASIHDAGLQPLEVTELQNNKTAHPHLSPSLEAAELSS
jgi:hypothetical protein